MHERLRPYSPLALAMRDDVPRVPLFVIHGRADRMSPYARSAQLVSALNGRHPGIATLRTIDGWWRQHMILTVCLHKRSPQDFAPLADLFRWLERRP